MKSLNNTACGTEVIAAASADAGPVRAGHPLGRAVDAHGLGEGQRDG